MGKSRAKGVEAPQRDEVSAKVDRSLVHKAKVIAAHRGVTVGEVLTDALRPAMESQYRQLVNSLAQSGA